VYPDLKHWWMLPKNHLEKFLFWRKASKKQKYLQKHSVTDPGCLSRIRIYHFLVSWIPDPDPTSFIPDPDPTNKRREKLN
jgi:hypothetical protein